MEDARTHLRSTLIDDDYISKLLSAKIVIEFLDTVVTLL